MREFVTAVEQAHEDAPEKGYVIKLDGKELHYYPPTEGQFAVYMASTGRHASWDDQVAGAINLFMGLFDEDDAAHLSDRLMDRTDDFGTAMIQEMLEAMIEDFTGRPTKPSTASTQSRTSGGRKSTRRTPVST